VEKGSQEIISTTKSTSHHIFYIHNCCKNNKFELLLQSLFDIINLEELFAFTLFAIGDIYYVLFTSRY